MYRLSSFADELGADAAKRTSQCALSLTIENKLALVLIFHHLSPEQRWIQTLHFHPVAIRGSAHFRPGRRIERSERRVHDSQPYLQLLEKVHPVFLDCCIPK